MIWFRGEVVPDDGLRIDARDRTFEHGLGLFETFRTWAGWPSLLRRHLERMQASARALGLDFDPGDLPGEEAVRRLRDGHPGDVRLRIVLSGGGDGQSAVWMTAGPLPPSMPGGARVVRTILADPDDILARHKTLNYWRRRIEQERAAAEGADEVLCVTPDGWVCEGTRSNLFLVRDGRLVTPGTDLPMLVGVMRRVVIDRARRRGIEVVEGAVGLSDIGRADEAFLTNSVRGMLPVGRLLGIDLPAPGAVTAGLWDDIRHWLESGAPTT